MTDDQSTKRRRSPRVRNGVSAIRAAATWARDAGFPTNPVTRRLRTAPEFEHDGKMVRNIHRTVDFLCDMLGGLIATQGYRDVLEIGTLFGYSTLHLAEAVARNDGTLDTVDVDVEVALPRQLGAGATICQVEPELDGDARRHREAPRHLLAAGRVPPLGVEQ